MSMRSFIVAAALICSAIFALPAFAQTLSVWPSPVAAVAGDGGEIDTALVVVNTSLTPAYGVRVELPLDAEDALLEASSDGEWTGEAFRWTLGTIGPGESARVALRVSGATGPPRVEAAQGETFSFTAASGVRALDPAAPASSMSASSDADAQDPYVIDAVARLGGDLARIDAFLQTLAWHPYLGSLRGARGALWSHAGNALDRTSLAIAMYRAAGAPARYARAELDESEAAARLDAIDVTTSVMAGPRIPPEDFVAELAGYEGLGTFLADAGVWPIGPTLEESLLSQLFSTPSDDADLVRAAQDHWWPQRWESGAWIDVESLLDAPLAPRETMDAVPESEHHKVTVAFDVELFQPAFGLPTFNGRTVLEATFHSAELIGRPLTLVYNSVMIARSGLVFTSSERTYEPVIELDGVPTVVGESFLELATTFPLASQFILGAELKVSGTSPGGGTWALDIPVADRLGGGARNGYNGDVALTFDVEEPAPGLGALDVVTLNIGAGAPAPYERARRHYLLAQRSAAFARDQPLLDRLEANGNVAETEADIEALEAMERKARDAQAALSTTLGARYFYLSNLVTNRMAEEHLLLAFDAFPRVVATGSRAVTVGVEPYVDIAQPVVQTLRPSGIPLTNQTLFEWTRGIMESELEGSLLESFLGPDTLLIDYERVFRAAEEQGAVIREFSSGNVQDVLRLDLPPDATAGIIDALLDGRIVITPDRPVLLNGDEALVWIERDPRTGSVISVDGSGRGIAAMQYNTLVNYGAMTKFLGGFIGGLNGFTAGVLEELAKVIAEGPGGSKGGPGASAPGVAKAGAGAAGGPGVGAAIALADGDLGGVLLAALEQFAPTPGVAEFIGGFSTGAAIGKEIGKAWVQAHAGGYGTADPPLGYAYVGWVLPFRTPLSTVELEAPPAGDSAGALPASLAAAQVIGEVQLSALDAQLEGTFDVRGTGTVLDAASAILVNNDAFAFTASALRAAALPFDCAGEISADDAGVTFDCEDVTGTTESALEIFAPAAEGEAAQWLRIETATTTFDALRALGRAASTELSAASARLVDGGRAWDVDALEWGADGGVSGERAAAFAIECDAAIDIGVGGEAHLDVALLDTLGGGRVRMRAPRGWFVAATETGFSIEPRGAAPGSYDVWLVADDGAGHFAAGQRLEVRVEPAPASVDLRLEYDPLYTTEWNRVPMQTVVRAIARNVSSEPATLAFSADATAPFAPRLGADEIDVVAGGTATVYIALRTEGELPPPGTPLSLTVTATSAFGEDERTVEFGMPEVVGLATSVTPAPARALLGESGTMEMSVVGFGNAPGTVTVRSSNNADVTWTGIPDALDIVPGETQRIELGYTVEPSVTVGFRYGRELTMIRNEMELDGAILSVYVESDAGRKARELAALAADLDEPAAAEVVTLLAERFDDQAVLCSESVAAEIAFRLGELADLGDAFLDDVLADELLAQQDAISGAGDPCEAIDLDWICATLDQVERVLEEADAALGPRVFVREFDAPSRVENGAPYEVLATIRNEGDEASPELTAEFFVGRSGVPTLVETRVIPSLGPGEAQEFAFAWDTSAALGRYLVEVIVPRGGRYATVEVVAASAAPDDNVAPVFDSTPDSVAIVGETWTYTPSATDADGDPVFVSAPLLPRGFRLLDGEISGRPVAEGTLSFVVTATDRYGASASQSFEVDARLIVDNLPPQVASAPSRALLVDQAWTYTPSAVDPDGDETFWVAETLPAGMSAGGDPFTLSYTPGADDEGAQWVALRVEDGRGGTAEHRFPLNVSLTAGPPDLAWVRVDASELEWTDAERSGALSLIVGNAGGETAAASTLRIEEGADTLVAELDLPALAPGETWTDTVDVAGPATFARRPLALTLDATNSVDEADETNNVRSTVGGTPDEVFAYVAVRPTEAQVVALAAEDGTAFRLIDPISGAVASEGVLDARVPTLLSADLIDGDVVTPLQHFAVESSAPLQIYVLYEIFDADFGGDLIHPALDGTLIGTSFALYVPTATTNNRLVITAIERADVVLYDADLNELASIDLAPGQTWEPSGLSSGAAYALESTGRLQVQSASVTGASHIPPSEAGRAVSGDVGRTFVFSTRSRGADGGALAVVGYEDATFEVIVAEGTLLSGDVAAGEVAFRAGFGELRGARLQSTGDVAVIAGDLARSGADRVELIGEDLLQSLGTGGRRFVVPTLENDTLAPYVLAGPRSTWVTIDGETEALASYGRLLLERGAVVQIGASEPVVVQTMGGGDRFFDYAAVARRVGAAPRLPDPVLFGAALSLERCAVEVGVSVRIGNAGGAPIPADATLELVAIDASGERVVAREALGEALPSAASVERRWVADAASQESGTAWIVRLVGASAEPVALAVAESFSDDAPCVNAPPAFVTTPPTRVEVGAELAYTALAIDPEGSAVRYDLVEAPAGTSLHPTTGRLRWIADETVGTAAFAIVASDPEGELAVQAFEIELGDLVGECPPELDGDSDGFCPPIDCDDTREDVSPAAPEIVGDGVDNDCDPSTPDAFVATSVGVALRSEFDAIAPGQPVRLEIDVINRSARALVDGLRVVVGGTCGAEGLDETVFDDVRLAPDETQTLDWSFDETDARYATCTFFARVERDDAELASAFVQVDIATALRGTFVLQDATLAPGDAFDAPWEVTNTRDVAVVERVSVRRADRTEPLDSQGVELAADASLESRSALDTAAWPTARLTLQLLGGATLLDEVHVDVIESASLSALAIPAAQAPDAIRLATGEAVRFRPDGPRAAAPPFGAFVQAAWWTEGTAIRLILLDESEDDEDSVRLLYWPGAGPEPALDVTWERADGAEGVEEEAVEEGLSLTFVSDQVGSVDAPGRLFVEVRDARTDDRWWFAAANVDAPEDAAGELVFAPIASGGDATPPDAGGDAGGSDAGADANTSDGGSGTDGGAGGGDAGASDAFDNDGTEGTDGNEVLTDVEGGCNCTSAPAGSDRFGFLLVLAGLLALRRGRSRGASARAGKTLAAALACALALGLAACGGGGKGDTIVEGGDGQDGQSGTGGGSATPGSDGGDAGGSDAGGSDAGDSDAGGSDAGGSDAGGSDAGGGIVLPDAGSFPDIPEPEGEPTGAECASDDDCVSGICQQGPDFAVCTQPCDAVDCPDGFVCEPFPGGVSLCVAVDVCLDEDDDGYGRGGGCIGADCNDANRDAWTGADERCDGIDNDCDGEVDEGVRNACGGCGPVPEETCNGLDDDCDGDVDEGVSNACGLCGAPREEICNGLDDDCDGTPDDGVCVDCTLGEERPCYGGEAGTEDVGLCAAGVQRCETNGWSACVEQTLPAEEVCDGEDNDCDGDADEGLRNACGACGDEPVELCDGEDNDCDGDVDEGVLSPCGGCTPCGETVIFPYEDGEIDPSVAPAPDGGITLGTGLLERHDIWVPNSTEDTVSRWDTRTGRELGRYYVGEDPSRTAVDLNGNVWVGNRGDGIATHIYTDLRDCVDRNRDGVIQTSRDLNGDGRITHAEMVIEGFDDPLADECVHCQVRVGNATDLVRGVGVDADNFAWLGTWNSRELYKVDPATCEIVAQLSTANPETGNGATSTYGLAIDPDGKLYTSSFTSSCVVRVDTATATVEEQICEPMTRYGMAAGPDGRIWYAGYNSSVISWDPVLREWTRYDPPDDLRISQTTGMVVDNEGRVYSADYNLSQIVRFDPETGGWDSFATNQPPDGFASQTLPRGVTIDAEGHVWGICRGTSGLVEFTDEGEWLGSYSMVSVTNPSAGVSPYSYSDNTGFQLFNIVAREGQWRDVIDAGAPVRFLQLETMAFVPESTYIDVQLRSANSELELAEAEWTEYVDAVHPSTVFDLDAVTPDDARLLEVRYRLRTDDPEVRPVLRDMQIRYESTDCRAAGNRCPSGQVCEPTYGGCIVPPRACFADVQCDDAQYCDATGACRRGCRLDSESCDDGLTCDPVERVCLRTSAECRDDVGCLPGQYCTDSGFCEEGCRLEPDSCPLRFRCEPSTRTCEPTAPECVVDDDCDEDSFCGEGRCVLGCRLDGASCGETERCDEDNRRCEPLPADCDPEMISEEICDGIDNDCDGTIDNAPTDIGVSCAVGSFLTGELVCVEGGPLCRANIEPSGPGESLALWATRIVDFSSEYRATTYSAARVLGPATRDSCGGDGNSWAPQTAEDIPQFLHVGFPVPLRDATVRILPTVGDNVVRQVDVVTTEGQRIDAVWTGSESGPCAEWVEIDLSEVADPIAEVVVHTQFDGFEELNGIQLVGAAIDEVPLFVQGDIEDAILPGAEYVVIEEEIDVTGRLWLEEGVRLAMDEGAPWILDHNGNGASVWTGVEIVNAGGDWASVDPLVMSNVTWTADPNTSFSRTSGELIVLDSSFTDVRMSIASSASATVTLSRFEMTEGVTDIFTTAGPTWIDESEFIGENIVPRRSDGVRVSGSQPFVMRDSIVQRMQRGVDVASTGEVRVEGSTLRDNDVGLQMSSASQVTIQNGQLRLDDPGHTGSGVLMTNTSENARLVIDTVDVVLGYGDRPITLDPDFFGDASTSGISDLTVSGGDPDAPVVWLQGNADADNVAIAPFDGFDVFGIAGAMRITGGTIASLDGVSIQEPSDNSGLGITVASGAQLDISNANFEGVYLAYSAGALASEISGTLHRVPATSTSNRNIITVRSDVTLRDARIVSEYIPAADDRLHTGVYVLGSGELTVQRVDFEDLRYGMFVEDDARLDASDVAFLDCEIGTQVQERVAANITGMSVTDDAEALASIGLYIGLAAGGFVALDGFTHVGDAADIAISADPDIFDDAFPSRFDNVTFDDDASRIVLRGDSSVDALTIRSFAGVNDYALSATTNIYAPIARVSGDVTFRSLSGLQYFVVRADSAFEAGDGTTFDGVRFQNFGDVQIDGTTFACDTSSRYSLVDHRGTGSYTDATFVGLDRRQDGLYLHNGSSATCTRCTFADIDQATNVSTTAALDTVDCVFDDVTVAYDVTGAGTLTALGGTVTTSDDPAQETFGAVIRSPADGLTLDLANVSFDLDDNDEVFDAEIAAFYPNRTVAMSGSTFPNGVGSGYQLQGTATDMTHTIAHLEDAQPAWVLDAALRFNGASDITVAADTVLLPEVNPQEFDFNNTSTLFADNVTFENITLRFDNESTGLVQRSTFSRDRAGTANLAYVSSTGEVELDRNTFDHLEGASTTRGVYVTGASTDTLIRRSTFNNLRYGIYAASGAVPAQNTNVFNECGDDTFGF